MSEKAQKQESTEKAEQPRRRSSGSDSERVEVPFGSNAEERAILLLAAAEESKQPASVVQTTSTGFLVEKSLADKAGLEGDLQERADNQRMGVTRDGDPGLDTVKTGAGPTGEVETNAGEGAEQGSVQDTADEKDAPRSNIEFVGTEDQGRRAKKSSAKKSTSDKKAQE